MRHRLTINLYDQHPLDAEMLDALAGLDRSTRQDILRMFCRVGYRLLVQGSGAPGVSVEDAKLAASLPGYSRGNLRIGLSGRRREAAADQLQRALKKPRQARDPLDRLPSERASNEQSEIGEMLDLDPLGHVVEDDI